MEWHFKFHIIKLHLLDCEPFYILRKIIIILLALYVDDIDNILITGNDNAIYKIKILLKKMIKIVSLV